MNSIPSRIAQELGVKEAQVSAAVALLDEGATVPFISRYRKEVTGGLDDTQMRDLESRLGYLRELEDRRETILNSIREQDKLSPELERDIRGADTKNRLEDLYLPYKPKRRTKGQIAIEAGLEPLATTLFDDPSQDPASLALNYLNPEQGITDVKGALDGAKYILMERLSENADLLAKLRNFLWNECLLCSTVMTGKEQEGEKFRDYFAHSEPLKSTPSHRALAMFRGRNESILSLAIKFSEEEGAAHPCEGMVAEFWNVKDEGRPADTWLKEVIRWTWRIKLYTHLETDLLGQLRELADTAAIDVFAHNLKDLLLAAPAGQRATIGLDPGMRTGVKVAVIDATGKVVDHCAIFPTPPQNKIAESAAVLLALIKKHGVQLIAIGNGTASRETERFVKDVLSARPELGCTSVMVNESGASIYSASEYAAKEFPDLDVTIRGAISIARRLQDPLAELVKIDPKSIGVGQYQHDVSQTALSRTLETVVEDCVNAVGVDVNTASPALLARVSGLNLSISANIVEYRDRNGAFKNREQLKEVSRFGAKTFEQAAGFLRVVGGDNPLDASAVHPESYSVVEKIVNRCGREVKNVLGDSSFLKTLKPAEYADERFGIPTVTDIFAELDKPGRDPRPDFKTATFKDGIEKISDLEPDMILEGVVTNVTNFGAFVDIGVHQDGLVHISALANQFVKDPHSVVKAGDIVKVKVMEVDAQRKRIALSMRLDDKASEVQSANSSGERRGGRNKPAAMPKQPPKSENTTMAALFAQAKQKKR
ncbi:Tex family protein [Zhongshania sp.]|uniref:Tex family protein n=1 Tax=Zhongshania sp. TaxID=1971902 RepID=UPI00356AB2F8